MKKNCAKLHVVLLYCWWRSLIPPPITPWISLILRLPFRHAEKDIYTLCTVLYPTQLWWKKGKRKESERKEKGKRKESERKEKDGGLTMTSKTVQQSNLTLDKNQNKKGYKFKSHMLYFSKIAKLLFFLNYKRKY